MASISWGTDLPFLGKINRTWLSKMVIFDFSFYNWGDFFPSDNENKNDKT
jgi:hypothetical protein